MPDGRKTKSKTESTAGVFSNILAVAEPGKNIVSMKSPRLTAPE